MSVNFEAFAAVLAEHFGLPEPPRDEDRLAEDLTFDSLMFYECVEFIEELAGHPIADDAIGAIESAGDLHRMYLQYSQSASAPLG